MMFAGFTVKMMLLYSVYRWCNDNGHAPVLLLRTRTSSVVINISKSAVRNLTVTPRTLELLTSFNGLLEELTICLGDVVSVYSFETGEGILLCDYPFFCLSAANVRGCVVQAVFEPETS